MAQASVLGTTDSSTVPHWAGFFAALVTLFVIGSLVLGNDDSTAVAAVDDGLGLTAGECVDVVVGSDDANAYRKVECTVDHDAQITGTVEHPDAGKGYPGERVMAVWFDTECNEISGDFLGSDVLDTTLTGDFILPTEQQWEDGAYSAACLVTTTSEDVELSQSVEDAAGDFARGDEVAIARLKAGDCFTSDVPDARDLRSTDPVELADCDDSFNGIFFGRGRLPFAAGSQLPERAELTEASTAACAAEFESHFKESASGFSYRFWRPSNSNWDDGDRLVLCAVLDDDLIEGPFTPTDYPSLFDLDDELCFNLTPELVPDTVALDGRVRPVECSEAHLGQKITSGTLIGGDAFPGSAIVEEQTQDECEGIFTDFVGIAPRDSEFGRFAIWFPDADTWADGDRSYGCAILDDEPLTGSVAGARR